MLAKELLKKIKEVVKNWKREFIIQIILIIKLFKSFDYKNEKKN
jgi:hypothetical protein